jgi:fibronectin type 3 domain-containing protein
MKSGQFLSLCLCALIFLLIGATALGFQERQEPSRFDLLVIHDPSVTVGVATLSVDSLASTDPHRIAWDSFKSTHGPEWKIYLDGRSGVPMLVEGQGIPWMDKSGESMLDGSPANVETLEVSLRKFVSQNAAIFLTRDDELVLNRDASLRLTPEVWLITFDRMAEGIPVRGNRYVFTISHGNLVSFGAPRWSRITTNPTPSLGADQALQQLYQYMQLNGDEGIELVNYGDLLFLPLGVIGTTEAPYNGLIGDGYDSALVWHFALRVAGEPGTWVGMVDAHSGNILSFYDDNKYAQVKGGVYPESDDQICPSGCEQPDFPMPFADVDVGGTPLEANSMGLFDCTPIGSTATTTLNGPYVRVNDNCGNISESVFCDNDLDLSVSPGIDCSVPPGSSPGNTPASRSSFYHLNRAKEHARAWLPTNTWLTQKLTDNVNINSNCNAYWNGSVNFYTSGGGCNNTGEIAGVVLHEWGHGMDQNDGGGYDNPSEAYADVSDFMYDHTSCIGRGFYQSQQCSGYGNACLDCTGIRDQDWDMREDHTPSTAAGFIGNNCGGGGGPCGKETHCEGYLGAETIWDLAARDLPAMGLDQATAWQLMDKLWFKSRAGSGSNAYNCTPPDSDGCGSTTWFTKLRTIDDDDGNLSNGTPHAAAIFAAFDRHNIACGNASDPSNQNNSSCPTIGASTLTGIGLSSSASLSWDEVPDADSYLILRNDISCDHSFTIVGSVPAPSTTFTDSGLANGFVEYYMVQAVGSNSACDGPVSNCEAVTPQPYAGSVKFDRAAYGCSVTINIKIEDANIGSSTTTATIWSTTEATPETVTLTEMAPGSWKYVGSINTTSDPPASDGLLSITDGDLITARYIDADDGEGGHDLVRETTAVGDCFPPVVSGIDAMDISDTQATVVWTTDQLADSILTWGPSKPPTEVESSMTLKTSHSFHLTGLQSCTVYYFQVSSTDPSGNATVDDNGGQYYYFETYGNFPEVGIVPCHAGQVSLNAEIYSCSDAVTVTLTDIDLNMDTDVAETVEVTLTSTTETAEETLVLTETGPNTSQFRSTIFTDPGTPASDGLLQTSDEDILTASYFDQDDGAGNSAVSAKNAVADCGGPAVSNLHIEQITNSRVEVVWTTEEPATSRVDFGPTPALGSFEEDKGLVTQHRLAIHPFDACGEYYFRVTSADIYGNQSVASGPDGPFVFSTWEIPGLLFYDGFETDKGWFMDGEWERGEPQGLGGSYGHEDPSRAWSGNQVLGTDLSGQGSYPGDYEPNTSTAAVTPILDATDLSNGKLLIRRKLGVEAGPNDQAAIRIRKGFWFSVWDSHSQTINDADYTYQTYDISVNADGNPALEISFSIAANESRNYAGWTLDEVIIKDGSLPDFAACTDCSGSPAFFGLETVQDIDACAPGGVHLSWKPTAAWGTGSGGTYAVYRSTTSGFEPGPANLVASGLIGTSFDDTTAPESADLYYIVRAESDEMCSTGPNNSGVLDGNHVERMARNDISQPFPGSISTLRVFAVNEAHVRLEWDPVSNGATYRVYRSEQPDMSGAYLLEEITGTFYEDHDEMLNNKDYYYRVQAANACGQE